MMFQFRTETCPYCGVGEVHVEEETCDGFCTNPACGRHVDFDPEPNEEG